MKEQEAFPLVDAVAAADELTDAQLKALLVWYAIYRASPALSNGVGFRKWLDMVSETKEL